MSAPMDWEIYGQHKDSSPLTSKEIEAFVALDEDDLLDADWTGADGRYLTSFFTESIGAYSRITGAVADFAPRFPDVILQVIFKDDLSFFPDMVEARNGACRFAHSRPCYVYDDAAEEEEVELI